LLRVEDPSEQNEAGQIFIVQVSDTSYCYPHHPARRSYSMKTIFILPTKETTII